MHALALALEPHIPGIKNEAYFKDCFENKIEDKHGDEASELYELVSKERPELVPSLEQGAQEMIHALNGLWSGLLKVI